MTYLPVKAVDQMIRDWQQECSDHPAIYNQGNVLRDRLATLKDNSHEALVEALKLARGYVIEAAADSNPALDALTTIDAALAECAKPLSEVA